MRCASVYGAVIGVHCGFDSGKVCYGWWVDTHSVTRQCQCEKKCISWFVITQTYFNGYRCTKFGGNLPAKSKEVLLDSRQSMGTPFLKFHIK
jgi:hypothetical protein